MAPERFIAVNITEIKNKIRRIPLKANFKNSIKDLMKDKLAIIIIFFPNVQDFRIIH